MRLIVTPTAPSHPPHLACLLCDPGEEFFTFFHLYEHYRRHHPEALPREEER